MRTWDDETLVLEAFCAGASPNDPPPVAPADLVTTQLAVLITDNDQASGQTLYFKRDHIYDGPGGGRVATVSPAPVDQTAPGWPATRSTGDTNNGNKASIGFTAPF